MIAARDIMIDDIIAVKKGTRLGKVIRLLVQNRITGLPVIDEDNHLIGMVTEKDVLEVLYSGKIKGKIVEDIMSTEITTFKENEDLMNIIKCLVDNNFRRVPITSGNILKGIITRRDIIKFLSNKMAE
jgi:CBS domain-containing protein